MLDPHFAAFLEAEAAALPPDMPPLASLPTDMVRADYRARRLAQNEKSAPSEVATLDLTVSGAAGPIAARLYTPRGFLPPGPCLVYFHGGGFVIGDLDTHDGHCRRLAHLSGALVLAVDYRLAPEHPFPAGHDDALAATRWAFAHAKQIGADRRRIGVGGDSAGGNLAAAVAIGLRGEADRRPAFQLLLYPVVWPAEPTASRRERDGPVLTEEAMAWFEACLAVGTHPRASSAAPAQETDLSGLPPAFVATAGFDMLHDEGADYAAALTAAGVAARHVDYPSLPHDFYVMGDVSPAAVMDAAREAAEAIRAGL